MASQKTREQETDVFTAIAHPVRREILEYLTDSPKSAYDLTVPFEMSRSAVSQHLAILLDAGLVIREKRGRERVYSIKPEGLSEVQRWIGHFAKLWPTKLDALESVLDELAAEENPEQTADET